MTNVRNREVSFCARFYRGCAFNMSEKHKPKEGDVLTDNFDAYDANPSASSYPRMPPLWNTLQLQTAPLMVCQSCGVVDFFFFKDYLKEEKKLSETFRFESELF